MAVKAENKSGADGAKRFYRAVRFSTHDAICKTLDCQPGDILEYVENGKK